MPIPDTLTSDKLPFSAEKQLAVLGHLIKDVRFFQQARAKITPEWFVDAQCATIYREVGKWYAKTTAIGMGRLPSMDELKNSPEWMLASPDVRKSLNGKLSLAETYMLTFGLDMLRRELQDWLQAHMYHRLVNETSRLYNQGKFDECYAAMRVLATEIGNTRFEDEEVLTFDSYVNDIDKLREARGQALTFGYDLFDKKLLPPEPGVLQSGSLLLGDTTILLAPSNVGKTTAKITISCHNIRRERSVLFIPLEGRAEDLKMKFWCSMLGVSQNQLFSMMKTPEGQADIDNALDWLKRYLVFVPYFKAGAAVEDVEAIIRRRQEERIAKTGEPFDLVVVDYPAKLITKLATAGGGWQRRQIDEIVYNRFVMLGLEYKSHMLLSIQANREGSKANSGHRPNGHQREESRLLTMEDVLESWGPMTAATNVISINRSPDAAAKNRVTFYICKSRSSDTGWAVVCNSKYQCSISHAQHYGGTAYRGSHSMAGRVDEFLKLFRDGEIPMEHVIKDNAR